MTLPGIDMVVRLPPFSYAIVRVSLSCCDQHAGSPAWSATDYGGHRLGTFFIKQAAIDAVVADIIKVFRVDFRRTDQQDQPKQE